MIEIRSITTIDSLSKISEIEEKVWNMPPLPVHQTVTAVKNGGIVIAAYDDEQMIGFSYGFAGFKNNKVYLCSHMLGIDERYRSKKIGERLKNKQREIAISNGYTEMRWTFDPLETRNAYLNLTKLNGVCSTYMEDAYGPMNDSINQGIPSDRFEIHWYLTSPHVTEQHHINNSCTFNLNEISYNENGLPVFKEISYETLNEISYAILVPKNYQDLKKSNHAIALEWRYRTRGLFKKLFLAGYAAVHLEPHENYAVYTFIKKETLRLGGSNSED